MTTDQMLSQAIGAVKSGRHAEARRLLEHILRRDRSNEMAWLWLSGTVETNEERLACLQEVLSINPGNDMARRGLERLRTATRAPTSGPSTSFASQPASPDSVRSSTPARSFVSQPASSPSAVSRPAPALHHITQPLAPPDPRPRSPSAKGAPAKEERSPVDTILRVVLGLTIGGVAAVIAYLLVSQGLEAIGDASLLSNRPAATAEPLVWQQWGFADGGFAVQMPGKPTTDVQVLNTLVGDVKLYMYTLDTGDTSYFAAYSDFPVTVVENADVSKMLDGARDGAVSNVRGTLVRERRIHLMGYPGREMWIEADVSGQKGLAHGRIYLVGARLYQTLAAGPKDGFQESNAQRFLNSFLLVQR